MADFNQHSLDHLKKLCKIALTPDEESDVLHSLKRVLEYVEQLDEVDTEHVKPCNYVLRSMLKNPQRNDCCQDLMRREEFLSNAPEQIGGMIRIPPVIKAL